MNIKTVTAGFALTALLACGCSRSGEKQSFNSEYLYNQMQRRIASGWNTWDTRSVLTHVLLPHGAAIDVNLLAADGERVNEFRTGNRAAGSPVMRPGAHSYDGYYTDISLEWRGLKLRVQSAGGGLSNVIVITPLEQNRAGGRIVIAPKALWRRSNRITVSGNRFTLAPDGLDFKLEGAVSGDFIAQQDKEIILSADKPAVITCGHAMTAEEAQAYVQSHAETFTAINRRKFGDSYDVYNAMQNVLAWDNIYDPTIRKVITPVSRNWNVGWSNNPSMGGFVLFCWDTYFAAMMLSLENKELAYANAAEITRGATEAGFVPNFYTESDYKSRDRSQPPVGSMAVWHIYQKHKEKWFLELLYDKLLSWNRWWDANRNTGGLLCWGSTPYEKETYCYWEHHGVNETSGGALESGLDNSHMYDDVPFDTATHTQKLNDAGLSSLYIMDCRLLALIADELGHKADAKELRQRGDRYSNSLQSLWDEEKGLYFNRRTDTRELSRRISPTNFYPMLAGAPTQKQAERMVSEHLLNPEEFWGDWVIPATPRSDPAFADNTYWRGRIWAPLNFLVYMGLRNYDLPEARKALSDKSKSLLLKSWLKDGYVFENYSALSGSGDDVINSDKFYHWGALLGYIALIEAGYLDELESDE